MKNDRKNICVVTTSRADYGIYQSVLRALSESAGINLSLIVGGTHLDVRFGHTVDVIEADGYFIAARVQSVPEGDSDIDIAKSMGIATTGYGKALGKLRPDLIIVLGDRYEMFCAALAALPLCIPVAHIHGGEETEGAMDNSLRHAMTKLAHLHLCSTELAARRIRMMGESPDRVIVSGAPALDSIRSMPRLTRSDLAHSLGVPDHDFILLTYHPETLRPEATLLEFDILWGEVENYCRLHHLICLMTLSNADTFGQRLNERLYAIARKSDFAFLTPSMGATRYYSAMSAARMMVGNSSSGIIESASVGCPVVNVGFRQSGREQSANTISVPLNAAAIRKAMDKAGSKSFRARAKLAINIYGDGMAGVRILDAITKFLADTPSVSKSFLLPDAQ